MKILMTTAALIAGLAVLPAHADVYTDATGDLHDGIGGGTDFTGFTHLDITQVEVTSTITDITFAITLDGDITATTWGKYVIGIDSAPGGDTTGNGWGRPILISDGMDAWVGSWADGAPSERQAFTYSGSWNLNNQSPVVIAGNTTTMTIALSDLGLTAGQTFEFDVYTTAGGGGDGAVDALGLATPSINDWSESYDSSGNTLTYTIVPEPSSLALLAMGGLLIARRRRG